MKTLGFGSIIATSTGELGQVRSIGGPNTAADDIDETTLDSTSICRDFQQGLVNSGEVALALVYDPTMVSHKVLAAMHMTRAKRNFIVYHGSSTGDQDPFLAYVKSIGREIPLDQLITCDVTLKVSGHPGYST